MSRKPTLIARLSRVVAEGIIPRLEAVERQVAALQPSASAIVAKADHDDDDHDDQTELENLIADMEKRQAAAEARLAALETERQGPA